MVFYFILLLAGLFIVWLLRSSFIGIENALRHRKNQKSLLDFKKSAENIQIDLSNCECKNAGYQDEVIDSNLDLLTTLDRYGISRKINSLFSNSLTSLRPSDYAKKTQEIYRSYLVYRTQIAENEFKFVSQAFPFDSTTLEFHIINQDIALYVDRLDYSRYLFTLKGR